MSVFSDVDCSAEKETTSDDTHKARHVESILHTKEVNNDVFMAMATNHAVCYLTKYNKSQPGKDPLKVTQMCKFTNGKCLRQSSSVIKSNTNNLCR